MPHHVDEYDEILYNKKNLVVSYLLFSNGKEEIKNEILNMMKGITFLKYVYGKEN